MVHGVMSSPRIQERRERYLLCLRGGGDPVDEDDGRPDFAPSLVRCDSSPLRSFIPSVRIQNYPQRPSNKQPPLDPLPVGFFGSVGFPPFFLVKSDVEQLLFYCCCQYSRIRVCPVFFFSEWFSLYPTTPGWCRVSRSFSPFFLVLPDRFDRKDARPASSRTRRVPGPPPPSWPFRTTPAAANRSASWGWPPSDRP